MLTKIGNLSVVDVRLLESKGKSEFLGHGVGNLFRGKFVGVNGLFIPGICRDEDKRSLKSLRGGEVYAQKVGDLVCLRGPCYEHRKQEVDVDNINEIKGYLKNELELPLISRLSDKFISKRDLKKWREVLKVIAAGGEITPAERVVPQNYRLTYVTDDGREIPTVVQEKPLIYYLASKSMSKPLLPGSEDWTFDEIIIGLDIMTGEICKIWNYDGFEEPDNAFVLFYKQQDQDKPSFEEVQKQAYILRGQGLTLTETGHMLADVYNKSNSYVKSL
jgi:hypothetical protein